MPGTARITLWEENRQLKPEGQKLYEQRLETKRLLLLAGNFWGFWRKQVEMWNRELGGSKNQEESKTREYVSLVDEWEF